jgi:predicted nucleic acid-binding Zn ribbon protein
MNDTDFDLLCEGASPEEAKRIRKLLAEWCKGDENSFPVQMALLTRAQWRAASRVPQLMSESHTEFERQLGELFGKFMQLVRNYEQSGQTKVKEMDRLLTFHGENVGRSIEQARSQLSAAEKVSARIQGNLKQSAGCWKEAQEAFEEEQRNLALTIRELKKQRDRQEWMAFIWLLILVLVVGMIVGVHLPRW